MSAPSSSLSGFQANILRRLPFSSEPAVMPNVYALNDSLLKERNQSTVALAALSMPAFFWLAPSPSVPALLGAICLLGSASLCIKHEAARAEAALDSRAVDEYCEKAFPSEAAMGRITARPQAFQMLLDRNPAVDLDKRNEKGTHLSQMIFFTPTWFPWNLQIETQKMYIDACQDPFTCPEGAQSIFSLIESNPSAVDYLLQSKKDSLPQEPADQVNVWKQVKHPSNIEKLINAGFNINAQDENGWTPLMHWSAKVEDEVLMKHDLIVKAINLGADSRIENREGKQACDLARPVGGVLSSLLKNTRDILNEEKPPLLEDTSLFRWLPWKPIACKGVSFYEVDQTREPRAWGVAWKIVKIWAGSTLSALILAPQALVPRVISACVVSTHIMLISTVAAFVFGFIDLLRAGKEAKRQAVNEYIEKVLPSDQAMRTINDLEAAQMLIEAMQKIPSEQGKKMFINKDSSDGDTLLMNGFITNFEVFKLLVDHGADLLKAPPRFLAPGANPADAILGLRDNGFLWAVRNLDLRFIEYIFQEDRDKGDLLEKIRASHAFQVTMWSRVRSHEMAQFLIKQGFDPNVQDAKGRTALMIAAQGLSHHPNNHDRIDILLQAGADLALKDKEEKTAKDYIAPGFCSNQFAKFLQFRKEREASKQHSS